MYKPPTTQEDRVSVRERTSGTKVKKGGVEVRTLQRSSQ